MYQPLDFYSKIYLKIEEKKFHYIWDKLSASSQRHKMNIWQRLTFYPLKWISLGGLHPQNKTVVATLQFWFNFLYFALIIVLAAAEISVAYSGNIYDTINSILTLVLYLHIISKYTILYRQKKTLEELLEQRSKFWNIEDFGDDIREKCEKMMKVALRNTKCYLGYSLSVVMSYLIQPIITGQLPVFLYVPQGWYYFLFCSFYIITPAIMTSIWGVDTIFYSISVPVSVQLKLLAYKFENMSMRKDRRKLRELVDYQNFLIWYCQKINKMSSGIFITQFLVAIATSCIQLFIASRPEFNLMTKITCLSYFTMQIVETAIYCFTTDLISESSAHVGDAAYRSNWYDISDNTMKKNIALVIVRSQKPVNFSGLGLVWINKETFTRIFKSALSFYTYLNTMVYTD